MMVLVQKCTTLGFSLHDGKSKKEEELNDIQKREAIKEVPPFSYYLSYMFSYQTVMVGPLCFYTDYKKYIDGDHLKIDNDPSKLPNPKKAAFEKLLSSVFFMTLIIIFGKYTPEIIATKEYLELPWYKWCGWWFFVILMQRIQYYYVWVFADGVANVSGFGFNGYDENGNEKWNLVSNVYPLKLEMAQTFKETLDCWNVATMFWLRRVAYDRVPKNMRTLTTYMLSAVWHGFFLGYYLTFATGALFTLAGRYARRSLRWRFVNDKKKKLIYDIVTFITTKIALAYATLPFVTMHLNPGWFCYKRVYFCIHIIALFLVVGLPKILPAEKKKIEEKEDKKKN
uniref:Membrane-bound O-acyltransferase domain-containing protein 2 n=1 Tax=Parastrongyloides trichosuri TaxID=131310 RepID=A0A0N5A2S9_PARTI